MRGHRPFVLAAMLALLLGGRGEALAQQGGAALRDSLALPQMFWRIILTV